MKNSKIEVSYADRILSVRFVQNAVISKEDLEEVYAYGNERSAGQPYCVMFEAEGHYEVSEGAIPYMSRNPNNPHIVAKAYVVNSKEAEVKTRLHLTFDKPDLKPGTFKTREEAIAWLREKLS